MKNKKSLKVQIWEELEARGWVTPLSEPPDSFCDWWKGHDHAQKIITTLNGRKGWGGGISAFKAWQCAIYRDEWNVRKNENAAGTGINYAYHGWFRDYPKPMRSDPSFLAAHRLWCKEHGKPDPVKPDDKIPNYIRNASSFEDVKKALRFLDDKMNMNKAIGWTAEDSAAANRAEDPF
jgi:hypothetical protein